MRRTWRRISAGLATSMLLIGLVGCGSETPDDPTPTSSPPPSEQPESEQPESEQPESEQPTQTSPDPDPEPAGPIVLPACDSVDLVALGSGNADLVAEDISVTQVGVNTFGPAAHDAVAAALQARGCSIYLPNSGFGLSVLLAELDDTTRTEFVAALDASAFVHEQPRPGVSYYRHSEVHEQDGQKWSSYVVHAFAGDVWVAESGGGMGDPHPNPQPSSIVLAFFDEVEAAN